MSNYDRAIGSSRWSGSAGWAVVAGVLLLVVGLRAVLSLRGYLYADDFAFRYWAATQDLDWHYLLQSYGGHVNPIGLLNQWWLQMLFPGSHSALACFSAGLWFVTLTLAALTAHLLTDRWQAAAVVVVILGMTLFTFEVTVWWAAAIYAGPYQIFLACAMYCLVRALRSGTAAWVWLVAVAYAGICLSFSRGFLSVLLLMGIAAGLPVASPLRLGLAGAWRWRPRLWITLGVLASGSVLLSASLTEELTRPGFQLDQVPGYMWTLLVLNVLPAIWGGPWRWFEIPPDLWHPIVANPAPVWVVVWITAAVAVLGCVWLWLRRPVLRAFLLWSLGFTFLVAAGAGLARLGTLVASVAYRYTFDVAWPIALLIVIALVPLWWERRNVSRWVLPLTALFAISAGMSTVIPARDWASNQSREYMANVREGLPRIPDGQVVLAQGVPRDLIHPGLMGRFANSEVVVTPEPGAPQFGAIAEDRFFGFAEDGSVEEQEILGPEAPEGPVSNCGYAITSQVTVVPLEGRLIPWDFYARVAYFSGTDTTMFVAIGGKITSIPVRAGGIHSVYFRVNGPGSEVGVSLATPGVTVCLTEITVGNRVHPGTEQVVPFPLYADPE